MRIKNKDTLVDRFSGTQRKGRSILVSMIEAALNAVDPGVLVYKSVRFDRDKYLLWIQDHSIKFSRASRIAVIGGGKASGEMALAIEHILGDLIVDGAIIVPEPLVEKYEDLLTRIKILPGSHPLPSEEGLSSVQRILS
ncbi:MAG: DUF4147 domain-containing protein, partial [Candidatus Ranarchaeia archaeon]